VSFDMTDRIVLSERDTAQVLKLLENPPQPSPALLDAARRRLGRGGDVALHVNAKSGLEP